MGKELPKELAEFVSQIEDKFKEFDNFASTGVKADWARARKVSQELGKMLKEYRAKSVAVAKETTKKKVSKA